MSDETRIDAAGTMQATLPGQPIADVDRTEWRRRSVHGVTASVVSQAVRVALQLGTQILLARLLLPRDFGLVAMVAPIVGFAQLFANMGLLEAVIQRPTISRSELSGLFWINVGAGFMLAGLVVLIAPAVAWFYGEPRTAGIMISLGVLLAIGGCSALPMAVMTRRLRFVQLAAIDLVAAVMTSGAGLGAAVLGWHYWSLVAMQGVNAVVILCLAWSLAGWRPSPPGRVVGLSALLRFGSQVTAASLVHSLSYTLDNVLVGVVWGAAPLGLYERGFRLMLRPVTQLTTPFARVAVPLLSRLHDDPGRYRDAYVGLLSAVLAATTPAILFATVMASPLVLHLLGSGWVGVVPVFVWFGVGALLAPINISTNWLFISQNRPKQEMRWSALASTLSLASCVAGLHWGVVGVAAARIIVGGVVSTPLLWWAVTGEGPVGRGDLARALYPAGIAGAAAFAALKLVDPIVTSRGLAALASALALAYIAYAVCYCLVPEGNRTIRSVWRMRPPLHRARA